MRFITKIRDFGNFAIFWSKSLRFSSVRTAILLEEIILKSEYPRSFNDSANSDMTLSHVVNYTITIFIEIVKLKGKGRT